MFTVNYIVAIAFIFLGLLIGLGKQYWLIAGYNTASKKEKVKVNIEAFGKFMMKVFIAMALIIATGTFIAQYLETKWVNEWIIPIAVFPGVTFLLIRGNSKKYKK